MKRSVALVVLLILFFVSSACSLYSYFYREVIIGKDPYFYPLPDLTRQNCDTLTLSGRSSGDHVVRVDGMEFNCEWYLNLSYEIDGIGFKCSGQYSSLEEHMTIEVYEGAFRMDSPFHIETMENNRDWDICDYDGDGAVDAVDSCPTDPEIWICACNVGDDDSDGDGVPDCADQCPDDPEKDEPGRCGCDVSDADADQDGMPDCLDECPADPEKEASENCGCGIAETDTDGDWVPDCVDDCPDDPNKDAPGICGCGVSDLDEDEDGLVPCQDPCPSDAWHDAVGDPCNHDEDNDGTNDFEDGCPFDPKKIKPGSCGCGTPDPCPS